MRNRPRGTAAHVPWLATSMAAALAVLTPLAARAAGERAAEPAPVSRPALHRASELRVSNAPHPASIRGAGTPVVAPEPVPFSLVRVRSGLVAYAFPNARAKTLGPVAAVSKYYRVPIVLWVEQTRANGRWGRVELPYVFPRRDAWIRLEGLRTETTWVRVEVDLSSHTLRVFKRDDLLFRVAGATGAPSTPTPPGEYVVTDRVPFAAGGYLGSFAFGISGIQPRLPAGWTGGNQLAIHGTNSPSSIGRSVSAGCIRVSERSLDRLRPLLALGTPVVIHP